MSTSERLCIGGSTDGTARDVITGYNGLGRVLGGKVDDGGGGGGGGGFSGGQQGNGKTGGTAPNGAGDNGRTRGTAVGPTVLTQTAAVSRAARPASTVQANGVTVGPIGGAEADSPGIAGS
ncbi:hypothetical protein ACWD5V_13030 [Streptomyces sp. NPDC002523]